MWVWKWRREAWHAELCAIFGGFWQTLSLLEETIQLLGRPVTKGEFVRELAINSISGNCWHPQLDKLWKVSQMTHWNAEKPMTQFFRKVRSSYSWRYWRPGSDEWLSYYQELFLLKAKNSDLVFNACTESDRTDMTRQVQTFDIF